VLFIGDDWAEDHHDVELVDEGGRRLARARLPEGLEGLSRLHALIAEHLPEEWADLPAEEAARRVVIGIETDRGPWVRALIAAGYVVFAINPMQVARYRERHSTSGAKSDAGDAHVLAEIVRLDRERRAKRRNIEARAGQLQAVLQAPGLRQPAPVQKAYAAIVVGLVRLIAALNGEIDALEEVVAEHFGRHRDAEIYLSQPGLGTVLSARILAEFGDDRHRFADAKSRKNYAGTSGCTSVVFSFFLHIDSAETTTTTAFDRLTVKAGATTLATFSNLNKATGFTQRSFALSGVAGSTVTLSFSGTEDTSLQTSFVVDDAALSVS